MSERLLVSIVVPVFNSPALEELVQRIEATFRNGSHDYEIVLVDDGSSDPRIWPVLEALSSGDERVRAVQLTRNFGQQAATLCGFREARGDFIVTMDDDLQHDPADIPLLLASSDHDIVIGQLMKQEQHVFRRIGSRIKGVFDRIVIGKPKGLHLSSFRVVTRTVVEGVLASHTPHPFLPALMFHISKDVVGVPVRHSRRVSGRSGFTLRKLLRHFSNLIISNSSILLRAAAITGIVFALMSFGVAALVVYQKLVHRITVQGWASLFAALLLIGGLLLLSVGIVGEYLIRIIESSEARPTYFVRRRSE